MAVVDAEKSFHFLIEIMKRTCFRVEIIFKTTKIIPSIPSPHAALPLSKFHLATPR